MFNPLAARDEYISESFNTSTVHKTSTSRQARSQVKHCAYD